MPMASAIAQGLRAFKKIGDDIDPDELREQLGAALDDPDVQAQLEAKPHSMIAGAVSRIATGVALRQAWRAAWSVLLLVSPAGYVGLAYLNLHFWARHLANRRGFTPLGSEWKLWRMLLGWASFALKYVEIAGVVILDLLFLIEILTILVLITIIGWALANPIDAATALGADLVSLITG